MTLVAPRKRFRLRLRGSQVELGARTWLMGVLNVTPDSFSDGGLYFGGDAALSHGLSLVEAGADIVDVGGESTRPGAAAPRVDEAEERRRVVPIVRALRERGAPAISVDTSRASVARAALDAGADLVNDVSGLRFDPELTRVVARSGAPVVLMHLRGDFETMHHEPRYADVLREVVEELRESLASAARGGIELEQTLLDPGIGFAKNAGHSLELLRRLPQLAALDRPLLVGPSRKSFIGKLLELPAGERLMGTAAAVAACVFGGAHVVRVHDVKEMIQVVRVCDAIRGGA